MRRVAGTLFSTLLLPAPAATLPEQVPPPIVVEQAITLLRVTFTHRAPGEPERVERDVEASEGSKWLVASVKVTSDKASCDAAEIALTVPGGGAFAAVGIATQPSNGFINLESLPLGVGRGPSAWSVLRGSSGRVTFAAAGPEAAFHLLFAVPKAATAAMLKLCSIGTAKVPPAK